MSGRSAKQRLARKKGKHPKEQQGRARHKPKDGKRYRADLVYFQNIKESYT
jgi:hypothetical protein